METHGYALLKSFRFCAAFAASTGRSALAIPAHGAGEVGLVVGEDERSPAVDGEGDAAVARELEANLDVEGTLDLARLHPDLGVRAVQDDANPVLGKARSSRVWRLKRTFLSVGTSRPQTSRSSSVRSSVASIGPWKNGEVSTTMTS